MGNFLYWIPGMLILTVCALVLSRKLIHYFQLESYQFHGYFKTILRQYKRVILPFVLFGIVFWFPGYSFRPDMFTDFSELASFPFVMIVTAIVCVPVMIFTVIYHYVTGKTQEKKALVITARVKRLIAVYAILLFLLQSIILIIPGHLALGFYSGFIALLPLIFALAAVLALPIERLIFRMYFNDAKKRLLQDPDLIRIGITGSYGKTSTKFVLAEILSQKYNVLYTPSSFNTPMGVTRIVRERLESSHQVFIGEMGARHVGEIRELSNLVHPHIGILTSVGPQHLDTFRTIERIRDTKYELIEALPEDGFAVFSDDGDIVKGLYDKTAKPKALVGTEGSDAWASDVRVSASGSRFVLHLKGMESIDCETEMLGEHNIRNIVVAAAVAQHLGLNRAQIIRGIASVKPVEHRLQLIHNPGGIAVIDDAFNTNPRSSKEAMKVLGSFSGRRILVTPGMVELGADEEKYNYEFGQAICGNADLVYLVGKKHTQPIRKGMIDGGFDENAITVCTSLNDAISRLKNVLKAGDVVMYENDLPDNYAEN